MADVQALLGGPRANLDADLVREAESLVRGARVRHGCDVLTRAGVLTDERLPFTGGSVTWAYRPPDRTAGQQAETAAVRRRATLDLIGHVSVDLTQRRLRLWTELQLRDGRWARYHLGVFEVPKPSLTDDGTLLSRSLALADKTHRWSGTALAEPWTVPATATILVVRDDLRTRFGETQFAWPTSTATVGQQLVLESGTPVLDAYARILQACGFDQVTVNEDGAATTRLLTDLASQGREVTYGAGLGKVLRAGTVEPLTATVPNVVRFYARQGPSLGSIEGNGLRTKRNQSTGPHSIDARGGTGVGEVEVRVEVTASNQAALDAVADADAQRYFAGGGLRWSGKVGLQPRHSDRDVIGLELPRLDLAGGAWLVTSWTYPLASVRSADDALMPLTAERRV